MSKHTLSCITIHPGDKRKQAPAIDGILDQDLDRHPDQHPSRHPDWQQALREAAISPHALLHELGLEDHLEDCELAPDFRCMAPRSFINKMTHGDINDPLLRQVLPLKLENDTATQAAGCLDPVGDLDATASAGLLHKYQARVLTITTAACAVHCRYCFRRNYPYQSSSLGSSHIQSAIDYIVARPEIDEVILSGGDPLVLANDKLASLIQRLQSLPQLRTLRIHTRLPVVLPERIDPALIDLFTTLANTSGMRIVMVIHSNHANELGDDVEDCLQRLNRAGVMLLNQSVLLKGVNDTKQALTSLSKRLLRCHTLPYYLHMLDATRGAMHFAVDTEQALTLHRQMESSLPGYLVPRLVREIAGKQSKTAISRI